MTEIEYFKRWAATYLMWVNVHFDQIVADVVRRHYGERVK